MLRSMHNQISVDILCKILPNMVLIESSQGVFKWSLTLGRHTCFLTACPSLTLVPTHLHRHLSMPTVYMTPFPMKEQCLEYNIRMCIVSHKFERCLPVIIISVGHHQIPCKPLTKLLVPLDEIFGLVCVVIFYPLRESS